MANMVATIGRPPVEVHFGENTYEAMRQASLASAAAGLAQNAANSTQALTNFRSTLAEGVSDFPVGAFFSSAETGELRLYKRIVGSPFYQDQGDNVVPLTKGLMLSNGPIATVAGEVGDGNRGLNFGEVGAAPANCVVELGKAIIDLRSGETVATGYGMFNVNPTTTANDARMRVVVEEVQFSRSAAQRLFNFKSGTGTRVSSYIKIGSYRANSLSAGGRIVTADGSAQAGVLTFVLEDGTVNYSGGSSAAVKLVEITTCSPHIRGLKIAAASAAGSPVMLATAITDFVLEDIWTDNLRANDHIVITGATRGTVRRLYSKGGGAGIGMTFNGTFADVDFDGLYVTDFTQGFNSGSSMVFTRCTARSCKAISNLTTQTDMTVGQFPAGAQFGCVDWAN